MLSEDKEISIAPNLFKSVLPYLRPRAPFPSDAKLKSSNHAMSVRSMCKCKLKKLEKLKETLLRDHPGCYEPIREQFELQEETIETLVQIEDAGLDYDEWVSIASDSAWTSRVLKLFLYI